MAPPRLELTGVVKAFGGVQALRGVDFALAAGSIHGVAGEMRVDGLAVRFRSTRDARAAGIGMDVGAKGDVVRIVKSLAAQGMAIIVLSTEPETVLSLADRVLVMRKGEIAEEFADCAISKDRLLAAA